MNETLLELVAYSNRNQYFRPERVVLGARSKAAVDAMTLAEFHASTTRLVGNLWMAGRAGGVWRIPESSLVSVRGIRSLMQTLPELSEVVQLTDLPEGTVVELWTGRFAAAAAAIALNPNLSPKTRADIATFIEANYRPDVGR